MVDMLPQGETIKVLEKISENWIGFKGVMYNLNNDTVKLESYVDRDNNNTWIKIDEIIDSGEWGIHGAACGGVPDQIVTWGGPMVRIRFFNLADLDFKNLSVREICVLEI
jgi:hypothetical protein